jgi:integrase
MGRAHTVNTNLPPGVRKRVRNRSGKQVTYYFLDLGGKPRKEISLGQDYASALIKWTELTQLQAPLLKTRPTFIDLKNAYIVQALPLKAPRTQRDNLKEIEVLCRFFGSPPAPIDEIRPIHVRQFMQWRTQDGKGHVRANREKALLSHMLNFARETGLTDAQNPCSGIKGFTEKGRSDLYVEDETFNLVLAKACRPVAFAMRLAYLTGQRPADLLAIERKDIKDGSISFTQQKTGAKLRIQIEGDLAALIEEIEAFKRECSSIHPRLLCNESGGLLSYNALRMRFDKARAAAGLDHTTIQFRDLRAKAATDKAESSGDIRQAQKQLGHRQVSMTEHYTRQRKGDLVTPTK